MHETLINKDKEIIESVESFKTERVCKEEVHEELMKQITSLNKEKSEKEETLAKEFQKYKSVLMELTSKKEIVLELEKLIVTQQETIDTVKKEGEEECTRKIKVLLDLIKQYAPYSTKFWNSLLKEEEEKNLNFPQNI